jgi:hypothetical protein
MSLSVPRLRHCLQNAELQKLFVEELGWDRHSATLSIAVDGRTYALWAFARKRGVLILECPPDEAGRVPVYDVRRKIEHQVTRSACKHLIIFGDAAKTTQIWQWIARQPGRPAVYQEHIYSPRTQSADVLIQKIGAITFSISDTEAIDLTGAVHLLRDAFDRDRVTRRFYNHFKREQAAFLEFVTGITDQADRQWYTSLMLNRLMFLYFIQKKGFLDGNTAYLGDRLLMVQQRKGSRKFQTFYRCFLLRLFHQGLSRRPRSRDLVQLLGNVPYLNGSLFAIHDLETRHDRIDVPDEAFERLFDFFDQYDWHLDARPLRTDREINPDILGHILEKYINQKQMGAYYTKEDVTDYIGKNTILPHLFDVARKKCAVAFEPHSFVWRQLADDPDRYLYSSVRYGVLDDRGEVIPLPPDIQRGVADVGQRDGWNRAASAEHALPAETWREHVARRQRCLGLREKLRDGRISQINDLITCNLDIRQFAADTIASCEEPDLLLAFYQAISTVTVLDPTCGSGAFLFAALNVLQPLYEACLDRMQAFVDDKKSSSPKDFEDFRRVLADVARHPNRDYFILKSIVVRNLYGVDIMKEAVEICKLRLALKLLASVQRVDDLEPLPDINLNIRSGNGLVGFATLEDLKKTSEGFGGGVEEAEIVNRTLQTFHKVQTEPGMEAKGLAAAREKVRRRLYQLTRKLDRYLAGQYGVNPEKTGQLIAWRDRNQPFHWFAEFYGILSSGGFSVIIGNPPYVEYGAVQNHYRILGYKTESCGNLYAFTIERSAVLLAPDGRSGMIVPHSAFCTDRMAPLMSHLAGQGTTWVSTYDIRPSKLFEGVDQRLAVYLTDPSEELQTFGSCYHRWPEQARSHLFSQLRYADVSAIKYTNAIAKAEFPIELAVQDKLNTNNPLGSALGGRATVYYHNAPRYWIRAMTFAPYFWNERDGLKLSAQVKSLPVKDEATAVIVACALNSSLFYWWFILFSDSRHLNLREIERFPFDVTNLGKNLQSRLMTCFDHLMKDFRRHSLRKECCYQTTGKVVYDEFYPRHSKNLLDAIDGVLARHYGFSDEELDFIINYDIKYRMGRNEVNDD